MQSIFVSALFVASSMLLPIQALNITDVDPSLRQFWCDSQVAQCPLLCANIDKTTEENSCWPENLYYLCKCEGNIEPNSTEYSQTIPYFTCSMQLSECIQDCGNNPTCSQQCKKTFVCGATDPTKANKTATKTSSSTASKTPGTDDADVDSDSGFASSDGTSTGSNSGSGAGSMALQLGSSYGMGIVVVGIAAAFVGL